MGKKAVFTFVLVSFKLFVCDAQVSIGVQFGATENSLHTNTSNLPSTEIKSNNGYSVSVPVLYKITSYIFVETIPSFTQKNYRINRTDSLSGIFEQYKNSYLQLPLSAGVTFGKQLQMAASVGGYIGYWLTGHVQGKTANIFSVNTTYSSTGQATETFPLVSYHEKYAFNSKRDNRIEFGWTVCGGLQYRLTNRYKLLLEYSYYQSLTDQQKKYMVNQIPQYNRTYILSIGSLLQLK